MADHHHGHDHSGKDGAACCSSAPEGAQTAAAQPAAVVRDPVCGMTVDPAAGKPSRTMPATSIISAAKAAGPNS